MKTPFRTIILGKIGSCYGIHGWLRLLSFTDKSNNIFKYKPWLIYKSNQWQLIELENWRFYNKSNLIKLKGINNRTSASLLVNYEINVESSQLPNLENGSYYWKDLIGCQVISNKDYNLGKVINILETGSNDVLVVKANPEDLFNIKERLIPYLDKQVVQEIDLLSQTIKVNWDPNFRFL